MLEIAKNAHCKFFCMTMVYHLFHRISAKINLFYFAEIGLTDKTYYLAAQSRQNMCDWVDRLHEAAVSDLKL